jgi:hypothetical protein
VTSTDSRRDEPPGRHFRSGDRCFVANSNWYVATREGFDLGPFPTRDAADAAVTELIELLKDAENPEPARAFVQQFAKRINGAANRDGK